MLPQHAEIIIVLGNMIWLLLDAPLIMFKCLTLCVFHNSIIEKLEPGASTMPQLLVNNLMRILVLDKCLRYVS